MNMRLQDNDLEQAKRQFLAQFEHIGCGGSPLAYVRNGELGCTRCKGHWEAEGYLGIVVKYNPEFRSLVVETKWLYEDELPKNYPYHDMFPHSIVDGVRLFPALD